MKKNTTKNSLVSKDHSNNSNRQYTGMGLTREKKNQISNNLTLIVFFHQP